MHPFQWQFKVDMARTPAHYHLYVLAHVVLMAPVILPAAAHSLSLFCLTTSNITCFQLSQDGRHNGKTCHFSIHPSCWSHLGWPIWGLGIRLPAGVTQHVSTRVLTHSAGVAWLTGCVPHRLRWHSFGWVVRCKRCHHTPGLYCTLTALLLGS